MSVLEDKERIIDVVDDIDEKTALVLDKMDFVGAFAKEEDTDELNQIIKQAKWAEKRFEEAKTFANENDLGIDFDDLETKELGMDLNAPSVDSNKDKEKPNFKVEIDEETMKKLSENREKLISILDEVSNKLDDVLEKLGVLMEKLTEDVEVANLHTDDDDIDKKQDAEKSENVENTKSDSDPKTEAKEKVGANTPEDTKETIEGKSNIVTAEKVIKEVVKEDSEPKKKKKKGVRIMA